MIRSVIARAVGVRRGLESLEAHFFNWRHAPQLTAAYAAFARHSQISSPRQPLKGRDLLRLLAKEKSPSMIELGSGTTSAVFAFWANRNASRYVAYEHDQRWANVAERCLRESNLLNGSSPVRVVPSRIGADGGSTGFTDPIPRDVDFVYVDGPPCVLASGRKVPNDDVVRLFEAGGKPRTIVVDGRFDTVDLIRNHPVGNGYRFYPSFDYCLHIGLWLATFRGREHTVFRRIGS